MSMARFTIAGFLAALCWVLLSVTGLQAQANVNPPGQAMTDNTPLTDNMFVKKVIICGKSAVDLARLALQKSANPQVKQFAQTIIQDHTKAHQELMSLKKDHAAGAPGTAGAPGVAGAPGMHRAQGTAGAPGMPGQAPGAMPDQEHQQAVAQLSQLQGAEFDKAYIRQEVQDHEKAVSLFEKEAKSGQDAQLKNFAETTLTTLKDHLKQAQDLERNLGGSQTHNR
jgi:putative membrane protein